MFFGILMKYNIFTWVKKKSVAYNIVQIYTITTIQQGLEQNYQSRLTTLLTNKYNK